MPFLGILEDRKLPHVPGTVLLEETAKRAEAPSTSRLIRHGKSGNANIVLVPQPSTDPNDPLNWSYREKMTALSVTLFGSILYCAVITSMFNPAFNVIAKDVHASLSDVVRTSGYFTLTVGVTGPLFSAFAHKYGKRPCFLFGAVMALIGHIIGATLGSRSYRWLVAARVIQGVSAPPYEALIYAVVSDMFFVHERGLYLAITNFVVVTITNLTGAVSGPIASAMGWEWLWILMIIFGGIHTILQFLFVPETSYIRDPQCEIDLGTDDKIDNLLAAATIDAIAENKKHVSAHIDRVPPASALQPPPKKTYRQSLAVYTTTYSQDNLLHLSFAPWGILTNAAIVIVVLIFSMSVVMYIVVAFIIPQAFARAPYHMNPAAIGRLSFGPFVGGLIASVCNGLLSDRLIKWCARRNHGVYEPEYRLIMALLAFLTGTALMGWGVAVADGLSPYACAALHGLILFGVVFAVSGVSTYAVDSYRSLTAEIFIICQTVKSLITFGFSYFVNDWTARVGLKHAFYAWGALTLGLATLIPLLFIFGKKYRSYWARHNLLEKWHILTLKE